MPLHLVVPDTPITNSSRLKPPTPRGQDCSISQVVFSRCKSDPHALDHLDLMLSSSESLTIDNQRHSITRDHRHHPRDLQQLVSASNNTLTFNYGLTPNDDAQRLQIDQGTPSQVSTREDNAYLTITALQHLVATTSASSRWCQDSANRMHELLDN